MFASNNIEIKMRSTKMDKYICICVFENIFSGRFIDTTFFEDEERILIRQSEKSEITMSIPISKINYMITIDGEKYSTLGEIKNTILTRLTK